MDDFPEAGMVSPVPSSLGYAGAFVNSTVYYSFFKGNHQFTKVVNPDGLLNFQKSIDRVMYNSHHLENYLTISNHATKAVIGCGHFVATFRAEVFEHAPASICKAKIVGGSENKYLDFPNDNGGFLRLATLDNYAYHLGNVKEDWMQAILDDDRYSLENKALSSLSKAKPLQPYQQFIGKVLHRLCFVKFKKQYFRYKGMSKEASEQY